MTAYIYGQAPGKKPKEDPRVPFIGGRNGRFLAELAEVDEKVLADLFVFRNVLDYWPGRRSTGAGDEFPMDEARASARKLMDEWVWGDTVLFAGWNVARAFEFKEVAYFKWGEPVEGIQAAVVPHPSGLNRFWNDASNRTRARGFWRQAVHEVMMLNPQYEGGMLV